MTTVDGDPPADDDRARSTARLLTTLMGDYWFAGQEYIPSAALVTLLAEFGVGEAATRAALSRMTRAGHLEGTKTGRTTAYRLAPAMVETARTRSRRIMLVGAEPIAWDGQWTCVAFSVPESDRHLRRALRRRLPRSGSGRCSTGCGSRPARRSTTWPGCSPTSASPRRWCCGRSRCRAGGAWTCSARWDVAGLRAGYEAMLAHLRRIGARIEDGSIGSAEALVVRTRSGGAVDHPGRAGPPTARCTAARRLAAAGGAAALHGGLRLPGPAERAAGAPTGGGPRRGGRPHPSPPLGGGLPLMELLMQF